MELEGVRHGEDRQGRSCQMHQPCHPVCPARYPCHPAPVRPGAATGWQYLRNTGQVLQGLAQPEVTWCGAVGPGSFCLCEHPALLGAHSPQPTSAPRHLLSCPQPINYKSAAVSPDAIASIVGWAVFGWRGNLSFCSKYLSISK